MWRLERALSGVRDASRLRHEHFADVLTPRHGFTRSEAQPTRFVHLVRYVFNAVHIDDLIMARSSSQLQEVVSMMEQCFSMEVTLPALH